jgi:hypothetical protein
MEFVDVPKSFLFERESPMSFDDFNNCLKQFPKKVLVVPEVKGSLRIKLLSHHEFELIALPADPTHKFEHEGNNYQFSEEEESLEKTPGILVSVWKEQDAAVTTLRTSYDFCISLFEVYKFGFGARIIADSGGVNAYRAATNSNRAHPTPGFGQEQISQQQYFRADQSFPLVQALLEKRLHQQTHLIVGSAERSNPAVMKLVGKYCEKTIATCGAPPFSRKETTSNAILTFKCTKPTLGFQNDLHIDYCDRLSQKQQNECKDECQNDSYLCRLFESVQLGLPTTCGYQFHFNSKSQLPGLKTLEPMQYFSCDGLGLAIRIHDGMSHHFLGWTFSHRTTPCMLLDNDNLQIYLNNMKNLFMVYAWGRAGGEKDYRMRNGARSRTPPRVS